MTKRQAEWTKQHDWHRATYYKAITGEYVVTVEDVQVNGQAITSSLLTFEASFLADYRTFLAKRGEA